MTSTQAWMRHGCYKLGSEQYFNMPLDKALLGCQDNWNALDHFDPTTDARRMFAHFNYLRTVYGALQDGFNLIQEGNWTYFIQPPGSNGTVTEMGLWSMSRSGMNDVQKLHGRYNDQVWMLFTNENSTKTWAYDCLQSSWIKAPFVSGLAVRNLFAPYETYILSDTLSPYNADGKPPYYGCLPSLTLEAYGFKAFVTIDQWVGPPPTLTRFIPGHDYRILANPLDSDAMTISISLEFDVVMDCDSVTNSLTLQTSANSSTPLIASISCTALFISDPSKISGVSTSQWSWTATLQNVPDGVLTITLANPSAKSGVSTGVGLIWPNILFLTCIRLQTTFCSGKARPTMSWFSPKTTMILTSRSSTPMASIYSCTRLLVQTCSVIRGILGRIGLRGRNGSLLPGFRPACFEIRATGGKVITS